MAEMNFRDEAEVALKLFEEFVGEINGRDKINQLTNLFGAKYNTQINHMSKKELLKLADMIRERTGPGISDEKLAWLFVLGYVVYRAEKA